MFCEFVVCWAKVYGRENNRILILWGGSVGMGLGTRTNIHMRVKGSRLCRKVLYGASSS